EFIHGGRGRLMVVLELIRKAAMQVHLVRRSLERDLAQSTVEYALVGALVVIAAAGALTLLGTELSTVFTNIGNTLHNAAAAGHSSERSAATEASDGVRSPRVSAGAGGVCARHSTGNPAHAQHPPGGAVRPRARCPDHGRPGGRATGRRGWTLGR